MNRDENVPRQQLQPSQGERSTSLANGSKASDETLNRYRDNTPAPLLMDDQRGDNSGPVSSDMTKAAPRQPEPASHAPPFPTSVSSHRPAASATAFTTENFGDTTKMAGLNESDSSAMNGAGTMRAAGYFNRHICFFFIVCTSSAPRRVFHRAAATSATDSCPQSP